MKKSPVSVGSFPSPDLKGWCSERVPQPSGSRRRNVSSTALTPFYSGRTLPSKWEDAERWICSPVSGKKSAPQQALRRPKSKSGPLGPPAHYSPLLDGAGLRNLVVGSPFSTGVLGAEVYYCAAADKNVARSTSGPGWSDLLSESYSLPSSQGEYADDKVDGIKDEENMVSRAASRRDMATQMSPEEGSTYSTCKGGESPSRESEQTCKLDLEVRDVQVDKRATMISWSRKHVSRSSKKQSPDVEDKNAGSAAEAGAVPWAIEDAASSVSKLHRHEAKISAWENLQKAKAEAAIRKLEMKLEKKRSSRLDKILKELKAAEVKAEKMRSAASKQDKITGKTFSFRRHAQSIGCFTCHA